MLPSTDLKPWYDRVVWLFVSRNFKADAKDVEALRTHDRFGISSWPQMIVFDPIDDRVVLDPPRDLPGFLAALQAATRPMRDRAPGEGLTAARRALRDVTGPDDRPLAQQLADQNPIQRALALEAIAQAASVDDAMLDRITAIVARSDEDVVVYLRALRVLAQRRPLAVLAQARALLAIANDPLRYEVLELLAAHPQPALAPVLNDLFAAVGRSVPSRNPNVVRMLIAPCLGAAGDAGSIDALAPLAKDADWRNGTTRLAVQALARLAERLPDERARVDAILVAAFPRAVEPGDAQGTRASLSLAGSVLDALAATRPAWKPPALPATWDGAARTAFLGRVGARS